MIAMYCRTDNETRCCHPVLVLALALILATLTGAAAGCKKPAQQDPGKEGEPTAKTTGAAGTIELVMWEQDADIKDAFAAVIKSFEAANPGITIKTANYTTEDLRTQYQTAAIAGGGPDLVWSPTDVAGPFSVAGIVQPVGDWISKDDFTSAAIEAVSDETGATWCVPVSTGNHLMLLSNKTLVPEPPATLETLVDIARSQSDAKAKKYGFAYNLNEPFWFVTFLGGYGERIIKGKTPTLDTPGMARALARVKALKSDDRIVPPDCDYDCADTLFKEGKVGMIINGDWSLPIYQKALGDNLVISPLPRIEETGQHMSPMVAGKCIFVNKTVKGDKLEAAKKFVLHWVAEATQKELVEMTKRLPALAGLASSAEVSGDPILAASARALEHGQPMPMAVELRVVWDAIRPELQGVMAGRVDAAAAGRSMQKNAETKIAEMQQ